MITTHAIEITKEEVSALRFPAEAVQLSDEHRRRRDAQLERAMRLGNGDRIKCRILFKDAEGLKQVHTTVWSVDRDAITLKAGVTIPVSRVLAVDLP